MARLTIPARLRSLTTTRPGIAYLTLATPAILAELEYSLDVAAQAPRTLEGLPLRDYVAGMVFSALTLLPWALLLLSLYALFTLRPSLLLSLVTLSFFIVSLLAQPQVFNATLFLLSFYLLLAGFNFGRAADITRAKEPQFSVTAPFYSRPITYGFGFVAPLGAALLLLTLTTLTADFLRAQVEVLPPLFAKLANLYLQSRPGFIALALMIAGIVVWALKELVEPLLLYYVLSPADALRLLEQEHNVKAEWERKFLKHKLGKPLKPPLGTKGVLMLGLLFAGVAGVLLLGSPGGVAQIPELLNAAATGTPYQASPVEPGLLAEARRQVAFLATWLTAAENIIRFLIHLLWGA